MNSKTNRRRSVLLTVILVLSMLVGPSSLVGQDDPCRNATPMVDRNVSWPRDTFVAVRYNANLSTEAKRQLEISRGRWNHVSNVLGLGITFSTSGVLPPTGPTLHVEKGPVFNDQGQPVPAGVVNRTFDTNGDLLTATIRINPDHRSLDVNGNLVLTVDESKSSSIISKVGDHEMGHTMGLGENAATPGATCGGQAAGTSVMNGVCGANDWRGNIPSNGPTTCDAARVFNLPQYFTPVAGGGGGGSCPNTNCNEGSGFPSDTCAYGNSGCPDGYYDAGGCCQPVSITPIIIDVDGSGFELTNAEEGVWFDFFGTGSLIRIAWTGENSSNAFLALDRNSDGAINSGKELFGNVTEQPQSVLRNGFLALAEFDKAAQGGNEDGVISSGDRVFESLRLWQDGNHNGVSEATELSQLSRFGISAIDLDFKESRRTDGFGNEFRYRAKVGGGGRSPAGRWAWDVFFVFSRN